MNECTDLSWFQRYDGPVATRDAQEAKKELVAAECDAQLVGLYRDLVAAVDGYAMEMSASLFDNRGGNRHPGLTIPGKAKEGMNEFENQRVNE